MNRGSIFASIAGLIFGIGWWLWIDGAVYATYHDDTKPPWFAYIPGVVGTIALVATNLVSREQAEHGSLFGDNVTTPTRIWLLCSMLFSFASLCASVWIMIAVFSHSSNQYPGIALIFQNALILLSSLMLFFGHGASNDGFTSII